MFIALLSQGSKETHACLLLSSLKVATKHVHVYCFHGKHFTCWDLRGILETDNFACKDSK